MKQLAIDYLGGRNVEKVWEREGFFIGENDFEERMNTDLFKFRQEKYKEGIFFGYEEKRIHYVYLKHPKERAAVVISHGFCEFVRKYDELIYYFYQLGYSVYFPEHRGHGYSYREVEEPDKVHITDFSQYVQDFKIFMDQIVKRESPAAKLFLFAHSMGGCIGARFLEEYPGYFEAAVLSSPMFALSYGKIPKCLAKILMIWSQVMGWQTKFVPGKHGFDNTYAFDTSSALSEQRYAYIFNLRQQNVRYQTYSATYGWTKAAMEACKKALKNAGKVENPILVTQAGQDTMVLPEAQETFVKRAKNATLLCFPDSKHEIFNALEPVRSSFFDSVFSFYEEHFPEMGDCKMGLYGIKK